MKTNKIKPIKKLMIFTIITVMIASLFAVPAFAGYDENTGQFFADSTVTYEQFASVIEGAPPAVAGSYCVTVYVDYLSLFAVASGMSAVGTYEFLAQPVYLALADVDGLVRGGICTSISFIVESASPFVERIDVVIDGVTYQSDVALMICFETLDILPYLTTYGQDVILFICESGPLEIIYIEPPADGEEQGIFAVWSKITQWIVQGLASVSNAFYADGKLTLLGTLCIIPVALGIAFLLIALIQKFLRLRG